MLQCSIFTELQTLILQYRQPVSTMLAGFIFSHHEMATGLVELGGAVDPESRRPIGPLKVEQSEEALVHKSGFSCRLGLV